MPQMKRPIFLSQVRPDGFISPVGDKTLQPRETALNQIEKKKNFLQKILHWIKREKMFSTLLKNKGNPQTN